MKEEHKVFYHEFGHFIANEINHLFYGYKKTMEILIYPCPKDKSQLCGENNLSEEHENLAEHIPLQLASLIYGCLFESHFFETKFELCFSYGNSGCNDANDRANILEGYTLTKFSAIEDEHIKSLTEEMKTIPSIDPDEYFITKEDGSYEIDIEKLRSNMNSFISSHYKSYSRLVENYKDELKKQKQSES